MGSSELRALQSHDLVGTGYGLPKPSWNKRLAEVDAGTPMGEYMRRFWHPIAISADIKDLPVRVRMLCEDLVVFRDKQGRAGVLYERCAHRGASLFYGRTEDEGLRCCYHGWMFDVQGRCVDQALEEGGGKFRNKVRQPWYPVQELYGLVFVYMGPPDKMPVLPRYSFMENLEEGEYLKVFLDSQPGQKRGTVIDINWLTDHDNIVDLGHAAWLHHLHSGPQFGPMFDHVTKENIAELERKTTYPDSKHGMLVQSDMPGPLGTYTATFEMQLPNIRMFQPPIVPGKPSIINWVLPTDNECHISMNLVRMSPLSLEPPNLHSEVRDDPEWTQRHPSDYQAQSQPFKIQYHSEEHLAGSDRGVIKMRRIFERELAKMEKGEPLMNVVFDPAEAVFDSEGGTWLKTPSVPGATA